MSFLILIMHLPCHWVRICFVEQNPIGFDTLVVAGSLTRALKHQVGLSVTIRERQKVKQVVQTARIVQTSRRASKLTG